MIIVKIIGGLGGQMFQYAYAKNLEQRGYKVKIDISKSKRFKLHGGYQLNKFKIDLKTTTNVSNFQSELGLRKFLKEKSLLFNETFLNIPKNEYVKGRFQTEKYFKEIRAILLEQFVIKEKHSNSTVAFSEEIKSKENSCSLHVRRGDFISDRKTNSIHGTCGLHYYSEAIKLINKKYSNTHFYVFSDDLNWAKQSIKIENVTYIDHEVIPHEDMHLMSLCKHNITANSSFSWWGAWLNTNKDKTVIAPKTWFTESENEVACESWIKL
ncbi:Glycosyl transferase family 11 [Polaribacter sp. KT25b]|uniref:alpha-1,2-fucosyltransferase n=1 Tax=Polaribacter sp. KT25b TaxID=1855336 RepID=UPI00087CD327|nr:alpha-1,2-fucosyltransferase [Polaribacter sp. KT25b]SDR81377.1 Glycosyl transferase family 11 [Polaribacter sp. KT25b]